LEKTIAKPFQIAKIELIFSKDSSRHFEGIRVKKHSKFDRVRINKSRYNFISFRSYNLLIIRINFTPVESHTQSVVIWTLNTSNYILLLSCKFEVFLGELIYENVFFIMLRFLKIPDITSLQRCWTQSCSFHNSLKNSKRIIST